jgi:hypothetical protein
VSTRNSVPSHNQVQLYPRTSFAHVLSEDVEPIVHSFLSSSPTKASMKSCGLLT